MCIWGCSLHHGDALRKAFCGADELTPAFLLFPTIFYVRKLADKTAAAAFSPLSWDYYYFFFIVIIIKGTTRFIFCKTSHVIVKTDLKGWIRKGHYNTFYMKMKYHEQFLGRPNVFQGCSLGIAIPGRDSGKSRVCWYNGRLYQNGYA